MNINNQEDKHIHDLGYKQFFYNKEVLVDLIVNQLHTPWADKLNLDDLKLISLEGVNEEFKKKAATLFMKQILTVKILSLSLCLSFNQALIIRCQLDYFITC